MSCAACLLLVRGAADLPRACTEVLELLSLQRRNRPGWPHEPVLGIWVDPTWTSDTLPYLLQCTGSEDRVPDFAVRESAGVDGLWTPCRLGDPAGGTPVSRRDLVTWLWRPSSPTRSGKVSCFIPAYDDDTPPSETSTEMQELSRKRRAVPGFLDPHGGRAGPGQALGALRSVHGRLLRPPLLHDLDCGRLLSPLARSLSTICA